MKITRTATLSEARKIIHAMRTLGLSVSIQISSRGWQSGGDAIFGNCDVVKTAYRRVQAKVDGETLWCAPDNFCGGGAYADLIITGTDGG